MSIFSKFLKKRQQPSSTEKFKVILKTDKKLSEEQRNAIITIVKDGLEVGADLDSIGMMIILNAGIFDPVILNRIKNGVEVII